MPVPYTFGTATASIPLSQLDSNFATAITIGNTAVQLGNTVTTLNNMTLANVTISSGNVTITNVSVTTANVSGTANIGTLAVVGNETIGGNSTISGNASVTGNVSANNVTLTTNLTLSGGIANGVAYVNTSKVVTTGSAITFDGTNFATTGTASATKFIPTGGAATGNGMYLPAANALAWSTNGTEAMRIDSSQNVGIGTTSPAYKLDILTGVGGVYAAQFGNGTAAQGMRIVTGMDSTSSGITTGGGTRLLQFDGTNNVTQFYTNGSERMRIDSSGFLLVGGSATNNKAPLTVQTAPSSSAYGQIAAFSIAASDVGNAGISVTKYDNVTTTSQIFARFLVNQGATASGQINANGASAAAFGSYSDSRLKENIVNLPSQLANIMALRPVEFDYIESEGGGHQIGFIAQEVQKVYPDLIGEREDGMLTLTDLNKNDARLIKAIQEQQALIQQLQADIATLKGQK